MVTLNTTISPACTPRNLSGTTTMRTNRNFSWFLRSRTKARRWVTWRCRTITVTFGHRCTGRARIVAIASTTDAATVWMTSCCTALQTWWASRWILAHFTMVVVMMLWFLCFCWCCLWGLRCAGWLWCWCCRTVREGWNRRSCCALRCRFDGSTVAITTSIHFTIQFGNEFCCFLFVCCIALWSIEVDRDTTRFGALRFRWRIDGCVNLLVFGFIMNYGTDTRSVCCVAYQFFSSWFWWTTMRFASLIRSIRWQFSWLSGK